MPFELLCLDGKPVHHTDVDLDPTDVVTYGEQQRYQLQGKPGASADDGGGLRDPTNAWMPNLAQQNRAHAGRLAATDTRNPTNVLDISSIVMKSYWAWVNR